MMKELNQDRRFIICLADKNLGPVILERDVYFDCVLRDHLLKTTNYKRLSEQEAKNLTSDTNEKLIKLYTKHKPHLTKSENEYFARSIKQQNYRTPQFYITYTCSRFRTCSTTHLLCSPSLERRKLPRYRPYGKRLGCAKTFPNTLWKPGSLMVYCQC